MQNLCQLRSSDDKVETDSDDDDEDVDESATAAAAAADLSSAQLAAQSRPHPRPPHRISRRVHRCEFVHDTEFRRAFLARAQYKLTSSSKEQAARGGGGGSGSGSASGRNAAPTPLDADGKPRDGKLAGLKAPSKEDALLRKLLANELRTESSRVLQAVRWIVARQDTTFKQQREAEKAKQREAERLYEESKWAEAAAQEQQQQAQGQSPAQAE
jgi:hypothetical protein